MAKSKLLLLSALFISAATLVGCEKPFEHTVFEDDNYKVHRSAPGSRPQLCYGRERQLPECATPWKLEEKLAKNPQRALTPNALEQIKTYALNADQNTAATWRAGGIIYRLELNSPRPKPTTNTKQVCRHVNLLVKPEKSDMTWQDLSDAYCF